MTEDKRTELGKIGFKNKSHTINSKQKIGGSRFISLDILYNRIEDFKEIDKKYGWKGKLSKRWNVSHTQVQRFINRYCLNN